MTENKGQTYVLDTLPAGSVITETNGIGFTARLPSGELRRYGLDLNGSLTIDATLVSPDLTVSLGADNAPVRPTALRASQLIAALQAAIETHGDLPCYVQDADTDWGMPFVEPWLSLAADYGSLSPVAFALSGAGYGLEHWDMVVIGEA